MQGLQSKVSITKLQKTVHSDFVESIEKQLSCTQLPYTHFHFDMQNILAFNIKFASENYAEKNIVWKFLFKIAIILQKFSFFVEKMVFFTMAYKGSIYFF